MKKSILLLACICLLSASFLQAQTVIFSDDFENGLDNWEVEGTWNTTTAKFFDGQQSLTDSPIGDYDSNQNDAITLKDSIDLSDAIGAELIFQAQYDIEENFDFCYVEGSWDNGTSWITLGTITGQNNSEWTELKYSLEGFTGESNVKFRLRINSDPGGEYDGIYIDKFEVVSLPYDSIGPLIIYDGPKLYEGTDDDFVIDAIIKDVSGIYSAEIYYEDPNENLVLGVGENIGGDLWRYVIPSLDPGFQVNFSLTITDNSLATNTNESGPHSYIAGKHLIHDSGEINSINSFGAIGVGGNACAVRFNLDNNRAAFGLIRNYTDPYRLNDSIEVHVWKGSGSLPDEDLIEPFKLKTEATFDNNTPMTRVDLRDFQALWNLEGDVFFGFTAPEGEAWIPLTIDGNGNKSYIQNNNGWVPTGDDYHIRLVTGPMKMTATNNLIFDEIIEIFPNPAIDFLSAFLENENHEIKSLHIRNAIGHLVYQSDVSVGSDQINIPIQGLSAGIYFLSFSDGKNQITKKFVKQ